MIQQDFERVVNDLLEECRTTLTNKGADYAGQHDRLANFKRNAERLGMTKYQVWAVYANKHVDAINNAIGANPYEPTVKSEPLKGRIVDNINYLILLAALLDEDTTVL